MKLLKVKVMMMIRWEPVCHKTEWQQGVLRNCPSALWTYIALPRISDGQPCGVGEGYGQSTWYIW
jgi:hypothetical protein